MTIFSFLLATLVQFGTKAYLSGEQARLQSSIDQLKQFTNKEENSNLKAQILTLNDVVADYKILSSNLPKFSKVVREFAPLVPFGVEIDNMRIDSSQATVQITGFSPTREKVIQLYENIVASSQKFPNVNYPLENVAKPVDINFHFTFNINPELIN